VIHAASSAPAEIWISNVSGFCGETSFTIYTLHNIFGIMYCTFGIMYCTFGTCIVLFGPCKKCYLLHSIEYCTSSFKLRRCVPALALAMYFSSAPLYSASRATPLTADGTNCNFIIKTTTRKVQ